jgi:hypothetical protein
MTGETEKPSTPTVNITSERAPLAGTMDEASSQGTRFCVAEHDLQIVPPHPSDPIMWRPQRRPRREAGAPRDGIQSLCGRARRQLLRASRSAEPKISDALEKSVTAELSCRTAHRPNRKTTKAPRQASRQTKGRSGAGHCRGAYNRGEAVVTVAVVEPLQGHTESATAVATWFYVARLGKDRQPHHQ